MEKTSREYAEKLANQFKRTAEEQRVRVDEADFVSGYMKAVEETNVKGLLEALIESNNLIVKLRDKLSAPKYGIILSDKLIDGNFNEINKATK